MKIEIKHATISDLAEQTNIRIWKPKDPKCFSVYVILDIGKKGKKGSDEFVIRLVTPDGLKMFDSVDSIIYARPMVVVRNYNYEDLWAWLIDTVKNCEGFSWSECVANLSKYFEYEYDAYKEY